MRFSSFLDKKANEARKRLGILRDIFLESELDVKSFLDGNEPYLFVEDPDADLDFGVRIYKIGSGLAYRIQRLKDTQPYGEAYPLDLESSFADLISDMDEDEAAEKIKKAVMEEIKSFFRKSVEAKDELISNGMDDGTGRVLISPPNMDISSAMSTNQI